MKTDKNSFKTISPTFLFYAHRDIFSEHVAPLQFEFGHVYENPNEWEQRFERKDFDNNRHSGKVIVF